MRLAMAGVLPRDASRLRAKTEGYSTLSDRVYKDCGWAGWRDWRLPAGVPKSGRFLPFAEARSFARNLGLSNCKQWRQYCKDQLPDHKPGDIPTHPYLVYKGLGWTDWDDWLGTGAAILASRDRSGTGKPIVAQEAAMGSPRIGRRKYYGFQEARAFVQGLRLRGLKEWRQYCVGGLPGQAPKPNGIPSHANQVYRNQGWINWGDWFGTGTVAPYLRVFKPFEEARQFARALRLCNLKQWKAYCRGELPGQEPKPDSIPADPRYVYQNRDGPVGEIGWEPGRYAPIIARFCPSPRHVPFPAPSISKARWIGGATAKANCPATRRSRTTSLPIPTASIRTADGPAGGIGEDECICTP